MRKDEFPLIDAYAYSKVNEVLDKIKAEIKEKYCKYDLCEWYMDYDYDDNSILEYHYGGNVSDILAIIDKYRTKSEDK